MRQGTRLSGTINPGGVLLLPALLTGCRRAPAFNVLGSFFPGWIACMLIAVLLTVLIRLILAKLDWERRLAALPLLYVSLSVFFACTLWLFFFE